MQINDESNQEAQIPSPNHDVALRQVVTNRRGLIVKAKAGKAIRPEMVKRLSEDDAG